MTVELRSRQAAAGIHAAVAQVEPRVLPTRRRLFGRRAFVAIVLAALAPPAGVALVNATRDDDPRTNQRIVDDSRTTEGNDEPRPDEVRKPDSARKPDSISTRRADDRAQAPTALGRKPSAEDTRRSSAVEAPATGSCDPLINDAKGDVDNPAIDILEGSIAYDSSRNALLFRHVIDDIPPTPPLPNEALTYSFDFDHDGMTYLVLVYIGPASYGEWYFAVQRDDRTVDQGPEGRRELMHPAGRVDLETDTVTVEVDIDEFNRGERRVSAEEGLPPAAGELKRGSTLTNTILWAWPRSAGPGPHDVASGCDFVVD